MQLTATTIVTMTSLELVEYINNQRKEGEAVLRHDNFMVKVPQVLGENNAPKFLGTQTYGNNNTRAIYIFPKREACLMAMSYSYELQAKVFDRMTELEQQLAAQEHKRIAERQAACMEAPSMALNLVENRALEGKDTKGHHFCNEYDMINRIVLGYSAAKYRKREGIPQQDGIRDHLNALEIAAIVDLQRVNTSLLAVGMEYQERKERLNALFMRKHNKAICLEVLRLAS